MAVINGEEYSTLATKYGNLLKTLKDASVYMYDALTIIAQMDAVEPTRDLIIPFDNVYQNQAAALTAPAQFIEVARALNNHVLGRARTDAGAAYQTVADWMTDEELDGNAVGFPTEWAEISKLAGQDVDDFIV
jgi:hypothetical protein